MQVPLDIFSLQTRLLIICMACPFTCNANTPGSSSDTVVALLLVLMITAELQNQNGVDVSRRCKPCSERDWNARSCSCIFSCL